MDDKAFVGYEYQSCCKKGMAFVSIGGYENFG